MSKLVLCTRLTAACRLFAFATQPPCIIAPSSSESANFLFEFSTPIRAKKLREERKSKNNPARSLPLVATMLFVPAPWRTLFRLKATSVVATVARVILAEVDLGMTGLPMMDMTPFKPALRMMSFATLVVAKVARTPVAGMVMGLRVQTAEL